MHLPDWRQVPLDADMVREATPGPQTMVLWRPCGSAGNLRHWERLSSVAGKEFVVAPGLYATAASAVRATVEVRSGLGKLLARLRGAEDGPSWTLPGGATAWQPAARNESLRHATGDWIFWLDADDRIDEANRARLRDLFAQLPREGLSAYVMKCVCLPDPVEGRATEVDHLRLFRNHPELRWEHRVHEQIIPAVRRKGGEVHLIDIRIQHTGYQDRALRQRKLERDLRLLKLEEAEQPEHPFTLFNLGCSYQELGEIPTALDYFRRSLSRSKPTDSIVRKLYAMLAQGHRHLGQHRESLAICREGRAVCPDDSELLFREGLACMDLRDFNAAAACFETLLCAPHGTYLASIDPGIRGYLTRTNLAETFLALGRRRDAEAQWRAVLRERPDYRPALRGLAEVCLAESRWPDLADLSCRLDDAPGARADGTVMQARAHLARQDFSTARRLLEDVIARYPEELWPRLVLTHVLLQEGRDWVAAEQALLAVLARSPEHPEASNNLAILRRQQGKGNGQSG